VIVLLQQTPAGSSSSLILMWALIIAIFYFLVIRPARVKQKKLQNMIDGLKVGDKVITNGGIFGTVVAKRGAKLQLRIAENVKVDISRNAIASMQSSEEE
jgi:preprotein translocase subunit YajC